MQNRYAADIGDFGKFQLLRYLFNDTDYKLKQIWYMYPDENHNNDGKYINYFEKIKDLDPFLEKSFKNIINTKRDVKALENAKLLQNCEYFSEYVNIDGKDNLEYRKNWFNKAISFSQGADFIFVDPDNGIATKVLKDEECKDIEVLNFEFFNKKIKSGKYIFIDEIEFLYDIGKCVLVYHHLNRSMAHDKQILIIKKELKKSFSFVLAIKHKPYSPRVYFFIFKEESINSFLFNRLTQFEKKFNLHWQLFL